MNSGFIIARLQPFHANHKLSIEDAQRHYDRFSIGIYVTPISPSNPFTYEERKRMVEYDINGADVFPFHRPENFISSFRALKGKVGGSTFVSGDARKLFAAKVLGFDTEYMPRRDGPTGSYVRGLIYSRNPEYRKYVNPVTVSIVEDQIFRSRLLSR